MQGFYASPFEATIDLGELTQVNSMSLGCVQDARPWIWLPENVEFYSSTDGVEYQLIDRIAHDVPEDEYEKTIHRFITDIAITARFVRVKANPRGKIPSWHLGAGFDRWTFVDEWEISIGDE